MAEDLTTPVVALTETVSVEPMGQAQDRVRLTIETEGGGDARSVTLKAKDAVKLGQRMILTGMQALGYDGDWKLVAVEVGHAKDPSKEGEVLYDVTEEPS